MKYHLNTNFIFEKKQTFGHGLIFFARNKKTQEIIILNKENYIFLESLKDRKIISDSSIDESTLSYFLSEQLLLNNGQSSKSFYCKEINFWLQVTDTCNLACDYCYIPSLNSKKTLDIEILDALASKLLDVEGLETVSIKIAGGEPFVDFKKWDTPIKRLIEKLSSHGIILYVRIISNLTVLTQEMIDFVKKNNIQISVSMDGIGDWHDKTRIYTGTGKGSFAVVLSNLEKLKNAGVKYGVMITVTSRNYKGIPALVDRLVKGNIVFRIADAKGGFLKSSEFQETMDFVFKIVNSAADYSFKNKVVISDLRTHHPSATPCSMGISSAAIYLDGSIYFCHTEFEHGKPVGSLLEDAGILEVIKRGKVKHFNLHEDCRACEYRLICAGGCPLYRVNGKSLMCSTYKGIIKQVFDIYEK